MNVQSFKECLSAFKSGLETRQLADDHPLIAMMQHLDAYQQSFLKHMQTYQELSSKAFLNFLGEDDNKEALQLWREALRHPVETGTDIFWNSPLEELFTGATKLELLGVLPQVLRTLLESGAFQDALDSKPKNRRMATDLDRLARTLIAHRQYAYHVEKLQAWELLCLSGVPEALEYAFKKLHLTRHTVNAFGESAIHLAVISNSRMQVKEAVVQGCTLDQPTVASVLMPDHQGLTAMDLAARYGQTDMLCYLRLLDGQESIKARRVPIYLYMTIPDRGGVCTNDRLPETVDCVERYGHACLILPEVHDEASVDFYTIARRLTCSAAHYMMQVGETLEELKKIISQHSYHKNARAYYAVKVMVDMHELSGPMTEEQLVNPVVRPDGWRAQTRSYGKHWVLKRHIQFNPEDIVSIHLCVDNDTTLQKVDQVINPAARMMPVKKVCQSEELRACIKAFLLNESFWGKHVYSFWRPMGMKVIPYYIQKMADLCDQDYYFSLGEFQKIAAQACPSEYGYGMSYLHSFISADSVTKSFYHQVMSAKSMYDLLPFIHIMDTKVSNPYQIENAVPLLEHRPAGP